MKQIMNQYTFATAASATFLAGVSYFLKMGSIGYFASVFVYAGILSTALVVFLGTQALYQSLFSETIADKTTKVVKPSNDPDTSLDLDNIDQSVIHINMNKICKTTGWHNHCGLNSLTHFMFAKLSAIPPREFEQFIKENPEYDALLTTFQNYYELPNKPSLQAVLQLLTDHVPTDREGIFAPVLRLHMGVVLPRFANELFETKFAAAISDCIANNIRDIAAAVYEPNKAFFAQFKANYDKKLSRDVTDKELKMARTMLEKNQANDPANNKYEINAVKIRETALLIREQNMRPLALKYWLKEGCQNYANYVADLENDEMITADQLQWFGERFNIGVEVYTQDSIKKALKDPITAELTHGMQSVPQKAFKWTMRVYNSGLHWTVEEPDASQSKADAHNQHYPSSFTRSYLANEKLSGQFKIYGGNSVDVENIKQIVAACIATQVLPAIEAPVTLTGRKLRSRSTSPQAALSASLDKVEGHIHSSRKNRVH